MISHVKLQTEIAMNVPYVSVPRWRQFFFNVMNKDVRALKDALGKKNVKKDSNRYSKGIIRKLGSQNLCSKRFISIRQIRE